MKYYHDRTASDLSPLTAGQPARIQDQVTKTWLPGTVNCTRPEPRSYEVTTQSGSVLRRNRRHLRPASTEMAKMEPKDEPEIVESDEPSDMVLHNVPELVETPLTSAPSPLRDINVSPGTSSDSQSSGTYRTRSGRAVIRPTRFTE